MVLGKLPVPGRPTIWITVGQGPTALAVGVVGRLFWVYWPFETVFQSISGRLPKRGRKKRKRIDESKNVHTIPTRTYCKCSRPLPYCNPNCRTPRHWKCSRGCLDILTLTFPFSLSPSLWETARYRLKYCLKGQLNPKQPTNQEIAKRWPKLQNLLSRMLQYILHLGRMPLPRCLQTLYLDSH